MHPTFRQALASLLLAIVIARALLPVGFMLSFEGGAPVVVFCSEHGNTAPSAHGHHHHHSANQRTRSTEHNSLCPFALAVHTAPPIDAVAPCLANEYHAPKPIAILVRREAARNFVDHPIRGPPLLS